MAVKDYHVLCRRLDALLWSKALKYSCSSCLACSDIAAVFDELIVDDRELLDDDGVRHRGWDSWGDSFAGGPVEYDHCGLVSSLALGRE